MRRGRQPDGGKPEGKARMQPRVRATSPPPRACSTQAEGGGGHQTVGWGGRRGGGTADGWWWKGGCHRCRATAPSRRPRRPITDGTTRGPAANHRRNISPSLLQSRADRSTGRRGDAAGRREAMRLAGRTSEMGECRASASLAMVAVASCSCGKGGAARVNRVQPQFRVLRPWTVHDRVRTVQSAPPRADKNGVLYRATRDDFKTVRRCHKSGLSAAYTAGDSGRFVSDLRQQFGPIPPGASTATPKETAIAANSVTGMRQQATRAPRGQRGAAMVAAAAAASRHRHRRRAGRVAGLAGGRSQSSGVGGRDLSRRRRRRSPRPAAIRRRWCVSAMVVASMARRGAPARRAPPRSGHPRPDDQHPPPTWQLPSGPLPPAPALPHPTQHP